MAQSYQVGDTEYQFPDNFTDDQVTGILSKQGIINAAPAAPQRPSDSLPDPATVDRMTTEHGRRIAEIATRPPSYQPPAVPNAPLPRELRTRENSPAFADAQDQSLDELMGGRSPAEVAHAALANLDPFGVASGTLHAGQGISEAAGPGKTLRERFGGASKAVEGGFEAATPFLPAAAVKAPLKTGLSLAAGMVSQAAIEKGLTKIGVAPEYARFAGDFGGLFAGIAAHEVTPRATAALKAKYEPILRARAERETATPPTANSTGTEPYKPPSESIENTQSAAGKTRGKAGTKPPISESPASKSEPGTLNPDTFMQQTAAKETPANEKSATPPRGPEGQIAPAPVPPVGAQPGGRPGGPGAVEPGTAEHAAQTGASDGSQKAGAVNKEAENSGEYFRGDWNVPLNDEGRAQVKERAAATAGKFDRIVTGTKDRHVESAKIYAAANPEAPAAEQKPAFDPMHMGVHEGEPVTPERLAQVNDHITNHFDEPIPGTGKFSGSPGESPKDWSNRLVGAIQDEVAKWKPGGKTLIVTSGRDVQAMRAWAARGMPADRSLDTGILTQPWKTEPGEMARLDPRTGAIEDVTEATKDGIYFARHGTTDANANSGVPAEMRSATGGDKIREPDYGTAGRRDEGAKGAAVHGAPAPVAGRVSGNDTDVLIPGEDRSIPARYEIRELSDIQPSHIGETFAPNPNYTHANERDYAKPENQQRVIENSSEQKFQPRYHITDNPDMSNGPVLIDEGGDALGGNSRTMILQRVYGRAGEAAKKYRELLLKKAPQFGIDPEAVRGMRQPVLVRVATNEGLAAIPGGAKWAIRKTNVSGTAALSSSERAAADAGQMTPEMIGHIAGAIENAGADATLNDALTGNAGTAIVNRLISEGFFSEQERPGLMDGKTGALTQLAKDRISKALLGQFFRDSDQIARTPAAIKGKLERIAAPLAKVAGVPGWDITPEVREAVDLIEYANAHGIRNLGDVVAQTGMFGGAPEWSDGAVKLAEMLRDGKPNDVVAAFRKFVNSKEPTMFGESTPAEAFREAFGAEKPEPKPPPPPETKPPAAGPSAPSPDTKPAAPEPDPLANETKFEAEREPAPPDYLGMGFGALEPLFREAKAEGDRLRAERNAALAAAKDAQAKPEQMKAGERIRAYLTSERDWWAARSNQAIDIVSRKVLPKIKNREALGIAREFRHIPGQLDDFIEGTHPFLAEIDGGPAVWGKNLSKLMPVLREAQRILRKPTARERAADAVFTDIAKRDLAEGRAGGWLDSRWQSNEYVPHALNPKGEGEVAKLPSTSGRQMGNVGKWFGFGETRSEKYPTMVHAVADGIIPKTLDPSALFIVHADQFARARATHMLEAELADSGLGKWGDRKSAPEGWEQLAAHTDEFKKRSAYAVPGSFDPESRESELKIGTMGLYVPPFISKALGSVTDPDYTAKMPGFAKLRTMQRGLKEAILGMSGFHLLTENFMAAADIGPGGMLRAFREPRESPASLANERDLIASGGTTSIQGSTMDAYRGMRPGTIPTRAEVVRAYIPGSKQALELADKITDFTFANVQRRFKTWAFALHRDAWIHDNPDATPDQLAEAKKGIASYVNGVYGGLHWENMGIPRAMVEISRALFLAPDWSGSNIALAKYAFDEKPSANEIPFRKQLAGATTKESSQARLSRAFWTKQLVGGLVSTQLLSLMFSQKLSRRPFQVYEGKDPDGKDVYQNVSFRGSIGDAVNLAGKVEQHASEGYDANGLVGLFAGILTGAGVFIQGKAAPVTKFGMHIATARDDYGRPITPGGLAGDVLPVPIVGRTVQKTFFGDESDKYLWSERMLSMFGPLAQHVDDSRDPEREDRRLRRQLGER